MNRGLVIGKFYPPHEGHLALIRFAAERCETLTVIVCHSSRYSIPGEKRKAWLERLVPANARVLLVEEKHADDDSEGWADRTRQVLGFAPEKVFSSEDYGPVYSGHLGSAHVAFDPERRSVPVSGSKIRENPYAHWARLPSPVRAHYALRIALVGPESTGKTTLACALADALKAPWVPEYGREYWEGRRYSREDSVWNAEEFLHIARMQIASEDSLAELANPFLICDTNALCTAMWSKRYLGSASAKLLELSGSRSYAHTFFCEPDFPHVQDGTRHSSAHQQEMARELRALHHGLELTSLSGSVETRLSAALGLLSKLPGAKLGK